MMRTSWENWKRWRSSYTMLPYISEMDWPKGLPLSWESFWNDADPCSFVLESGRTGRYTYIGLSPFSILTGSGEEAVEQRRQHSRGAGTYTGSFDNGLSSTANSDDNSRIMRGRPLDMVRQWMSKYRSPVLDGLSHFAGGCVGFAGYDVVRSLEKLPTMTSEDLQMPDFAFMMVDQCWVYDHERKKLMACVHIDISQEMTNDRPDDEKLFELYRLAGTKARQMLSQWQSCVERGEAEGAQRKRRFDRTALEDRLFLDLERDKDIRASMSKEQFTEAVERIQEYIRAGDVFQVNLSVRQDRPLTVKPEVLYEWLRLLNPSPYMGMLRFPDFALVSASPELLIEKDGRRIRTRPIAGTRRRGETAEEDRRFESELRSNEKERAEHVMLVDLERNDIGKVAEFGSVWVDQLMVIERYSHVMHLVSDVSGMLREGLDSLDALAALFPGGTITGAPKIRTMEIIEELETVRRGVYTGSFGWIDYNDNMEFNIIIRTLLATGGRAYVQAGAGIVIDSIPEREYKESLSKAKALWKAVQYAEQMEEGVRSLQPKEGGMT